MKNIRAYKHKILNIILCLPMILWASSVFSSNGISALYERFAPAKQYPLKEACHTPAEIPQIRKSGGFVTEKSVVPNAHYVRTEHRFVTPALPVVTMHGVETSLEKILDQDQPVMLNFIFTKCTTICPVLSATFTQVQDKLSEERQSVKMVSISIDPEYDTPDKLQAYAQRFNAGPNWQFVTGEAADIIAIEKVFDAYRGAKMSHEPLTYIKVNGSSPWVRLEGITSADDILNEYKRLVVN